MKIMGSTAATGSLVAVFGALFDRKTSSNPVGSAYDASNTLLDSFPLTTLTLTAGNNVGNFVGFVESGNLISSIVISGGFVGATDLVDATGPEPTSLLLLGSGLVALGLRHRRQR
jgi:hypothetical protein